MSNISFSTNQIADIELSFDDLFIIENSLTNAIEHAKIYLSSSNITAEEKNILEEDISSFSKLSSHIEKYLSDKGLINETNVVIND